ncbi:unnamed protein product [Prunus armeniaca]
MVIVSVFSASPSSLNLSFHFGLGNNWNFRTFTRSSACLSQESRNLEPNKKQDKTSGIGKTRSATKDQIVISNVRISQRGSSPPLVTALKASAEQNAATFHFPGHNRGRAAPSSLTQLIGLKPFLHDLPELPELDNLFSPRGPILDAQQTGSQSLWVIGRRAISAMVLSGAVPKYIIPDYNFDWDIAGGVTPSQASLQEMLVETAIKEVEKEGQKPAAVLVTSPTYHGICSNLSEITQLCHSRGIPVIVDEAHGAHLGFHPQMPNSAMHQGADLAVQSTHKDFNGLAYRVMKLMKFYMRIMKSFVNLLKPSQLHLPMNLGTCREHVQRLVSGIKHLVAASASTPAAKRKVEGGNSALFADIETSLIPRDAFFSGKRRVSIEKKPWGSLWGAYMSIPAWDSSNGPRRDYHKKGIGLSARC